MKKRLYGKPACIAILAVLIILSLTEVILRNVIMKEAAINLSNVGEPLVVVVVATLLILFSLKGKDRLFYLLCGAWLGYFVLNDLFALPGSIANLISRLPAGSGSYAYPIATAFQVLSMIGVIAIGGLLLEYMNDGTIYNKAFNTFCIITILMLTCATLTCAYSLIFKQATAVILVILHNLSRIAMVFLFTFFAYDSAKDQMKKTKE